jgi:hypothetical protein
VTPGATTTKKIKIIGLYILGNRRYLTAESQFCLAYWHLPGITSTVGSVDKIAGITLSSGRSEVIKKSYLSE